MALKIYNTLSRKKEQLNTIKKNQVLMFVCGPTVYDHSHIGHARSYIQFDMIAKYLVYSKYQVKYVQNITDIDDKVIQRANEIKKDPLKLAREFEKSFMDDMKALNVNAVTRYARATEHIKEIKDQITRLYKKGFAYDAKDGVYFDISKFKDYGKLSHQNIEDLKKKRIEPNPNKKNPGDFALWKKEKQGEPSWPSQWGKGRPGWHIEDTAIAEKYLGAQYDIHGGGEDLIFPHHEAEIAQMEAATGKKPFVRYWIHNAFLRVNGKKMSKSLGNFLTIKDALKKWKPEILRYLFLSVHYKIPINFTEDSMKTAEKNYNKLIEFMKLLEEANGKSNIKKKLLEDVKKGFSKAMDNDFNISAGLAEIFAFMRGINKIDLTKKDAQEVKKIMLDFDKVLSLNLAQRVSTIPKEIQNLVNERENARKAKKWDESDKLRENLRKKGWEVQDTSEGPKVRKI